MNFFWFIQFFQSVDIPSDQKNFHIVQSKNLLKIKKKRKLEYLLPAIFRSNWISPKKVFVFLSELFHNFQIYPTHSLPCKNIDYSLLPVVTANNVQYYTTVRILYCAFPVIVCVYVCTWCHQVYAYTHTKLVRNCACHIFDR